MAAFDQVAASYDQEFTDTPIGRIQRKRVWNLLQKILKGHQQAHILELNCGTGEDALFLAQLGHRVMATDLSGEMLEQARKKVETHSLSDRISLRQLDLADPVLEAGEEFDLIFSNFGGLNCLSFEQLKVLNDFLNARLKPGGACVFVIMPPKTFLEKVYRSWKNERHIYQQRSSKSPLEVRVGDELINTYFHSAEGLATAFDSFKLKKAAPVGFIPSYFERSSFLPLLKIADACACFLGMPVNRADHYWICLEKVGRAWFL